MSSLSPIAAARRSTELGLVVMAGCITGAAYTLASLGKNATIPPIIIPFLGVMLGLLLVAAIATRLFARGADPTLLPLVALLHGLGCVMITRLDDRLAGLQTTWTFIAISAIGLLLQATASPFAEAQTPPQAPEPHPARSLARRPAARQAMARRSCPTGSAAGRTWISMS